MAAGLICGEYTFTSSTRVSITTVLGLARSMFLSGLVVRADKNNGNDVYWGTDSVTLTESRGGYLEARDAVGIDLVGKYTSTDGIYLVGTSGDTVYITGMQ